MLRRTFLAGSVAALAVPPPRAIDAHVHFYDPGRPGGVPWPPKSDSLLYRPVLPAAFARLARPFGVRGVIVVEASPLLEDNQWVLDLAPRNPLIKGFVGHLPCGTPEFAGHLARFSRNPLFRGIRLNDKAIAAGLPQPAFIDHLKRLADADLEFDAIGGPALLPDVLRLSDRLPALRIVVHHLPIDGADARTLREVGNRPAIYAKVSDVLRPGHEPASLDPLWEAFGPNRLIYASNWPVSDRVGSYAEVIGAVRAYFALKGPDASDRFFWRNSQAAYRWTHIIKE